MSNKEPSAEINSTIKFGIIKEGDIPVATRLAREHLGEHGMADFEEHAASHPELALAANLGKDIVGICFGHPNPDGSLVIQGIAVESGRAGAGIGSLLLAQFEALAVQKGYKIITVGSAGGYVEHFYIKNGYTPNELLVTTSIEPSVDILRDFDVRRIRKNDNVTLVNIVLSQEAAPNFKEFVKDELQASEVNYIFEKVLTH